MEVHTSALGFHDRAAAGRALARQLEEFAGRDDVVVLGIPRGGVPVAFEVARALGARLDIIAVRKLGLPGHEELAMGAIASGGVRVLNPDVLGALDVPARLVEAVAERELRELERREHAYRNGRPAVDLAEKTVVVVDDGLATGSTMLAAISAVIERGAGSVICAVPVAPPRSLEKVRPAVDEVVCGLTTDRFFAVGQFYEDFAPTSDAEVTELLAAAAGSSTKA